MRKHGFTLAEILITLGIIGVVAALTAPTLVNNAANAQIRPTLTKAVSALEQVNLAIINNNEYDSLADIPDNNNDNSILDEYVDALSREISGAVVDDNNHNRLHMKGNIDIEVNAINPNSTYNAGGGLRGHFADVIIDIDGVGTQPNDQMGNDQYRFAIDRTGSVLPYGGRALYSANNALGHWSSAVVNSPNFNCDSVETAQSSQGINCAGSAMENDDIIFR